MNIFKKKNYGCPGVSYYYLFGKEIGMRRDNEVHLFDGSYVGWNSWTPAIKYETCGYEYPYGELHISLLGWHSVFKMPFKSKKHPYGDCDPSTYGWSIHDGSMWFYWKNKTKSFDFPLYNWEHISRKIECVDGTMRNHKELEKDTDGKWLPPYRNPLVNVRTYEFTDNYDGKKILASYWVEERTWKRKWLCWTNFFKKTKRYIEIKFDDEVGKNKGSWKGGCIGCSYDLKPGETPEECIKRMETERRF